MNDSSYERLVDLLEKAELTPAAVDCVLAAAGGQQMLAAHLSGGASPRHERAATGVAIEPARAFLEEIAVEGFRGVGSKARLQFDPAPGLTLVVGRNGSGKSSFAEGLEVLLTGTIARWADKTAMWREGWQNLHHTGTIAVTARFRVDGEVTPLSIVRSWTAGEKIDGGTGLAVSGPRDSWAALGWQEPLEQYRPILSYSELGTMFSSRAAALYEALSAILGLEDFDTTVAVLRQARLDFERASKDEKPQREAVRGTLAASNDPRAVKAAELLAKRNPEADAVLACAGEEPEGTPGDVRPLAGLAVPTVEQLEAAFDEIDTTAEELRAHAESNANRLDALAELLETGLRFHHEHGAEPPADCPVCGAKQRIDEGWELRAQAEATELRQRSTEFRTARTRHVNALRAARDGLLPSLAPRALEEATAAGLDLNNALAAWQAWSAATSADDATFVSVGRAVATDALLSLDAARAAAEEERERRNDAWKPLRNAITDWHAQAGRAQRDNTTAATLKAAEAWLGEALVALRRERLAPIVDAAKANWDQLRHESNVAVGNVELRKSGQQRFAAFDVAVDGAAASAYGVMSQGELSALAVSVFLPRATLPGTPFAFVVIDDPVQSMDPAKVDGLARVFAAAAKQRQVIIFTHDERLPEAIRRLGIDARIMQVKRRAQSKVEIVVSRPPSDRYIGEAFAIAKADHLPPEVLRRVIPGFCRSAIEAACEARIRRRMLDAGISHAEIDERVEELTSLTTWLAEAFELPIAKGNEIRERVARLGGPNAVEVVRLARTGAHQDIGGDPEALVEGAKRLVHALEDGR